MPLNEFCDYIILIAAFLVAIRNIYDFFAKPTSKIKSRQQKRLDERVSVIVKDNINEALEVHNQEKAIEYNKIQEQMSAKIEQHVIEYFKPRLDEVIAQNNRQNENIDKLIISSKDMLRQRIMNIYHSNKKTRVLTLNDREVLDELLKDYKLQNGNSYIEKYAKRMADWEVLPDDYDTNN